MGFVIKQSEHPLETAGKSLMTLLHKASDRPTLLLLSGGSAVGILNHVEIPYPNQTTISLVDERFTIDPKHQNITAIEETESVRVALDNGAHFEPVLEKDLSFGELALKQESFLKEWRKSNPYGAIFAVLGVGEDSHTAGIFPFVDSEPEFHALFQDGAWVRGYDVGEKSAYSLRITVTDTFLTEEVDAAVVYVTGESKKEALLHLLLPFGYVFKTPIRILRKMKRAFLYTDITL